jgi:toxin ParE1/3/4
VTLSVTWTVRLSQAAQDDFEGIIDWTVERFGEQQANLYAGVLIAAIQELHSAGPGLVGVKVRDDIGKGILTLHVARAGRKGRHLLMLHVGRDQDNVIDVVRILHDAMDLPRHLPVQ